MATLSGVVPPGGGSLPGSPDGAAWNVQRVTTAGAVTVAVDTGTICVDGSLGAVSIPLPAVATSLGRHLWVKRLSSTGAVTVSAAGADTLEGGPVVLDADGVAEHFACDGTSWVCL